MSDGGKWARRVGALFLCLACGVGILHASGFSRDALWPVVSTCAANHALTGAAFPCLAVSSDGYATLRSPLDPLDTIVSPTRRVIGIEDPLVQGSEGARAFAAAYASRGLIPGYGDGRRARVVVLAVNSKWARSQDQLHVHIGCAAPRVADWFIHADAGLVVDRWSVIGARVRGATFWGRRIAGDDLRDVNPFALADALAKSASLPLADMAIATMAIRGGDGPPHFALIAGDSNQFGHLGGLNVERFIGPTCEGGG